MVYALLGANYRSCHGEIVRDDLTLCSLVMVELRMRKREKQGDGAKPHEKPGLKRILYTSQFTTPDAA